MNIVKNSLRAFFFISWLGWLIPCYAQDSIISLANSKWEADLRSEAYLVLDRGIFFSSDSLSVQYYAQKATYKMMEGEFERASWLWDKVFNLSSDTLEQDEALLLKSYCLLKLNEVSEFYLTLEKVSAFNKKKTDKYKICGLLCEGYIDSASCAAKALFNDSLLCKEFSRYRKTLTRNENVPFVLNLILPGLGHACNGDLKNTLNSFLLNGVMGVLFYNTVVTYQFIDGALVLSPWLIRYYIGSARLARKNCTQAKTDSREKLILLILKRE